MRAPQPLSPPGRLTGAALTRLWKLPEPRTQPLVERGLEIPMQDGTVLLADHYAPGGLPERPTILVRTPYGRGLGSGSLAGVLFTARGYHVLVVSCRGTFGSGGSFRPLHEDVADGQDVVAWLRDQEWFDGRLATWGASYLGFTQWALAMDPPPELRAMIVIVGFHDVAEAGRGEGPLELENLLVWSDVLAYQERLHPIAGNARIINVDRRLGKYYPTLPLNEVATNLGGDPVPFFREWVDHASLEDPYWGPLRLNQALERVQAPVLLVGGWYDFFLDQTLEQYETLRRRGIPTRLVMGPWTHLNVNQQMVTAETLAWLDHQVSGEGPEPPRTTARIFVSGANSWLDLSEFPGPWVREERWYLDRGARLGPTAPRSDGAQRSFRYDPEDPTPSVGGRVMTLTGGPRDNARIEVRDDVLVFSSAPLEGPLEVRGRPEVTLSVAVDSPHVDLFCRLCDVDPQGVSRNLVDRIVRRDPERPEPGRVVEVHLRLDPLAHRFLPGHRIRLQIAGGSFPRFARNLGTGEPDASGADLRSTEQTVHFGRKRPSFLTLPVIRVP